MIVSGRLTTYIRIGAGPPDQSHPLCVTIPPHFDLDTMRFSPQNFFTPFVVLLVIFIATPAFGYKFNSASDCPNGTHWAQEQQPLQYFINNDGSDDLPMQTVEQVMERSFNAWSSPCCSKFSATYGGQTPLTAYDLTARAVLSFEEDSWPSQLGSSTQTIGITIVQVRVDCTIQKAPIIFNGVNFKFCENADDCTDLQSIATHEIGHNLGLNHSGDTDATMYATYDETTAMRTLAEDDIDGVCALYPNYSCPCAQNSDCAPNQECSAENQCEKSVCTDDSACSAWQKCDLPSGECVVPTCSNDADCDAGFQCNTHNKCISSCPVCRRCTSNSDCGANGICDGGVCLPPCGPDRSCPGDSTCINFTNAGVLISSGTCNSSGDCESGEQCFPDAEGGGTCATPCTSNGQCGENEACYGLVDKYCIDASPRCLNPDANSNGVCNLNYVCEGGENDPCLDVSCPSGQVCRRDGQCVDVPEPDAGTPGGDAETPGDTLPPSNSRDSIEADSNSADTATGPDAQIEALDASDSDTPLHVYIRAEGCACATSPMPDKVPGGLMLLGAFGLGIFWKRKQRKC